LGRVVAVRTWHDEGVGVSRHGAAVVQPAQRGRGESRGLAGQGHKVVDHHRLVLGAQAHDAGRDWSGETAGNVVSIRDTV